jgi:hypothetical protein
MMDRLRRALGRPDGAAEQHREDDVQSLETRTGDAIEAAETQMDAELLATYEALLAKPARRPQQSQHPHRHSRA